MDIVPTQPLVKSSLVKAAQQPATRRQRRAQRIIGAEAVERVQVTAADVAVAEARADLKLGAIDRAVDRVEYMAVNAAERSAKLIELAPTAIHEIGDYEQLRQLATRQIISQLVDDLGR